ncbi:MAG: Rieske 2Fe-2S domain-containing protein [Minicystis sp.]
MNEKTKPDERDAPRWREDFPIRWERDHYVTRRELAKFLTLGSALLAGVSVVIAAIGRWGRRAGGRPEAVRVASASAVPPGGSALFRYPTDDDPCILLRAADGSLRAYSQVCTHLSCAVVHRPAEDDLFCPCHHGHFAAASGRPTAGPPTRRLPVIVVEQRGDDVFALGKEV